MGSTAKADVALAAGAEIALVRGEDDLIAAVKQATAGHGADVVFDPVGGAAFDASTKCVAFEGRIIVVGFAGGTIPSVPAGHVLREPLVVDAVLDFDLDGERVAGLRHDRRREDDAVGRDSARGESSAAPRTASEVDRGAGKAEGIRVRAA